MKNMQTEIVLKNSKYLLIVVESKRSTLRMQPCQFFPLGPALTQSLATGISY